MFKSILKYLTKKEWALIAVIGVFNIAQVWLNLRMPEYTGEITLLVQTPGSSMDDIYSAGIGMLLCAVGSLIAVVVICFIASRVAARLSQRMRSSMFERVDEFSLGDINKFSLASLITRSTNDVTQVQFAVTMGLQLIMFAPMLAVWATIKIIHMNIEWTYATGIAMACVVVLFAVVLIAVFPKFKKMQELTDNVNRVARENLTGLPVVRAYNAEEYQDRKFERANEDLTVTQLFTQRSFAVMLPMIMIIMNLLMLAVYWIGAILIDNVGPGADGVPIFANMMVVMAYAMMTMMAIMLTLMIFVVLPRAQVAARRIYEVIETEPSIKGGNVRESDSNTKGEVEFRNVSFKYPGAVDYVLKDVSFKAKQGETVAFIGSTGSGKTTLINLVPRFYDVTEGAVLVDGIDVREYELSALYEKIGYIPQKSVLFTGTVTSNVAFGEKAGVKATEDDVRNAVRIAQGQDFVEEMPEQYEGEIARGGTNLSGGQKQRLSIARAICKNPEIYIFDDSFSALDYKTDRALRTALKKETKGVTSMIVAQRIGTIMDADRIIVLDKGEVVGVGTHRSLLKTCDVYREIAISQLSEKELAI